MQPLDLPQQEPPKRKYHRRSSVLFIIYGVVMFAIILISILKPQGDNYPLKDTVNLIVGLSCFFAVLLSPLGLYWSIQGFREKEQTTLSRVLHIIGHLIMFALLIIFLVMLFGEISSS